MEKIKAWMLESSVAEGSYLPSERELAEQFRTSRVSVRQALEDLEKLGWIERQSRRRPLVLAAARASRPSKPSPSKGSRLRAGMIIHSESDAYAQVIIKNVFAAAKLKELDLRVSCASDFGQEALLKAAELKDEGCDALIIPWVPKIRYGELYKFVHRSPLPASVPVPVPGMEDAPCGQGAFSNDTDRIVVAAFRLFRALGRERIALLGPDSPGGETMERHLMAYTRQVCEAKLQSLCGFAGPTAKDMDAIASDWAAFSGSLAVICFDDASALRFMASMRKLGLSAPEGFAVVGCNDTPECLSADPPLSSFSFDYSQIAGRLLDVAVSLAAGSPRPAPLSKPPSLAIRRSCGGFALQAEAVAAALRGLEIDVVQDSKV